jgi:cobalt-zinc-cadmium efflux system membrane fusion protein
MIRDLAATLALVVWLPACVSSAPAQEPQPPPGEVWLSDRQIQEGHLSVEPVGTHAVGGPVVAGGRIAFDDLRVAHVYSPVTGRVKEVLAEPGHRVRAGAPLAYLESPDVGQAFSDEEKARADLRAAEHEIQRQKELYDAHAGSKRDLETAEDNFGKARAEDARAREKAALFHMNRAEAALQRYALRSPIAGEVIARNLNPGTEVLGQYSGGQSLELFTIGELDRVWVVADVFAIDLPGIAVGSEAHIKVFAYPDRDFVGKVEWISDALDPIGRTAKVRCTLANPDRLLKPEMFATVEVAARHQDHLAVPKSAVLRLGEQTVVFVEAGRVPDGRRRFEERPVEVDASVGGDWLPVQRGVSKGDKVVTSGGILLVGLI